jgi:hypothetical protein
MGNLKTRFLWPIFLNRSKRINGRNLFSRIHVINNGEIVIIYMVKWKVIHEPKTGGYDEIN